MPNTLFIFLFYSLFMDSFGMEIAKIYFPNAAQIYVIIFYALPIIHFLLGGLSSNRYVIFIRSGLALVLPLFTTILVLKITQVPENVFPLTMKTWSVIFPFLLPLLVVSMVSLIVLRQIRVHNSVWNLMIATALAQMILFSNVNKLWYPYFPVSLAAGALLQLSLRLRSQKTRVTSGIAGHYAWTVLLITAALYTGYHYPEFKPDWFQPIVSNINAWNTPAEAKTAPLATKQLFAWDNNNLGKPWQPNNTPIFYAAGPEPVYWRSQVYNMYNGNNWLRSSVSNPVNNQPPIPLYPLPPALTRTEEEYKVRLYQPISSGVGLFLPSYSKALKNIKPLPIFETDPLSQTLTLINNLPSPSNYTVSVTQPAFKADQLRKSAIPPDTNEKIYQYASPWTTWDLYSMEEREKVSQLTTSLTTAYNNPYDKIQALITYLQNHETYTLNPPAGNPKEDLVSNFLFNTHQGYCVHFFSALVTMVQSLNYPARWVVGFNEGEPLPEDMDNPFLDQPRSNVHILTQANAHSWAEVYFPDYGWIPFEATPGFSYPQTPVESTETPALTNQNDNNDLKNSDRQDTRLQEDRVAGSGTATAYSVKFKPVYILITILVLLALSGLTILLKYLLQKRRWRHMSERERMKFIYEKFLKKLYKFGIERYRYETPSEFAKRLSSYGNQWERDWLELTKIVEEGLYANDLNSTQVQRLSDLTAQILDQCRSTSRKVPFTKNN